MIQVQTLRYLEVAGYSATVAVTLVLLIVSRIYGVSIPWWAYLSPVVVFVTDGTAFMLAKRGIFRVGWGVPQRQGRECECDCDCERENV